MRTRSFAGSSVPAEEDWEKVEGTVKKRIEETNAQPSSNLNGFRMVALLPHFGCFDVPTLEEVAIRFFMASEPTMNTPVLGNRAVPWHRIRAAGSFGNRVGKSALPKILYVTGGFRAGVLRKAIFLRAQAIRLVALNVQTVGGWVGELGVFSSNCKYALFELAATSLCCSLEVER
jgi:hypothetical protein